MTLAFKRLIISALAACMLSAGAMAQRDDKKTPDKQERVIDKKDKEPKRDEPRRDNEQDKQKNDNRKKPDG